MMQEIQIQYVNLHININYNLWHLIATTAIFNLFFLPDQIKVGHEMSV